MSDDNYEERMLRIQEELVRCQKLTVLTAIISAVVGAFSMFPIEDKVGPFFTTLMVILMFALPWLS